jgi:hypothetical protein
MKPFIIGAVFALTLVTPASAFQTTTISVAQAQTCSIEFDQDATSLAQANAFRYKSVTAASSVDIAVTCSGSTSPFTCITPLPNKTVGNWDVQITASEILSDGTVLSSTPSIALSYRISNGPAAPKNLHIKK